MAFNTTIEGRILLPPANKRYPDQGKMELIWGTYENTTGGDTGGEIDPGCDDVVHASISSSYTTPGVDPRIQLNTASAGKFTITTIAEHDGTWMALCQSRNK